VGKQISFFMDQNDEKEFVDFVYLNADILIKEKTLEERVQAVRPTDVLNDTKDYIYNPCLKIVTDEQSRIHYLFAEAIEYCRTEIRNRTMEPGRLWIEMKYWTVEDGKDVLATKTLDLDKKYKLYKMYITKKFQLSKDKFAYIGPGAYELYKQGWKMMAGPIVELEFAK
jgi:hypothetical protein